MRRRTLLAGEDKPIAKIVSIDGKKTSDSDKASRL
jgi:hypothetical protein